MLCGPTAILLKHSPPQRNPQLQEAVLPPAAPAPGSHRLLMALLMTCSGDGIDTDSHVAVVHSAGGAWQAQPVPWLGLAGEAGSPLRHGRCLGLGPPGVRSLP